MASLFQTLFSFKYGQLGDRSVHGIHRGGKFGVSNEKSFVVNDLPEIDLGEVADTMESADEIKFGHTAVGYPKASRYGWMRMALKANQKIVIESEGNQIDSKFSPCLAIFDSDGRKLKSSTRTGFLVFRQAGW